MPKLEIKFKIIEIILSHNSKYIEIKIHNKELTNQTKIYQAFYRFHKEYNV